MMVVMSYSPHLAIMAPKVAQALARVRVVQRQCNAVDCCKVLAAIAESNILARFDGHLQPM
jgi:hypothetical protein